MLTLQALYSGCSDGPARASDLGTQNSSKKRMVNRATPATIHDELRDLLEELFSSSVPFQEADGFKIRRIRSLIEQLQKTDRIDADRATADFETYFVNYGAAMRAVRNIAALGAIGEAALVEFRVEANFLNSTRALELSRRALAAPGEHSLGRLFFSCVSIGAFQTVVDTVDASIKEQRVIKNDACIPLSRKAASVLRTLGVTDADVAACIDVAGTMLQDRKLLWLSKAPDVHVVGADGGEPGLAMEFRLPVSAAQASEMTWEWCSKLIDSDLYKDGVTFGFVGVR